MTCLADLTCNGCPATGAERVLADGKVYSTCRSYPPNDTRSSHRMPGAAGGWIADYPWVDVNRACMAHPKMRGAAFGEETATAGATSIEVEPGQLERK
jgi:hypothetical protein